METFYLVEAGDRKLGPKVLPAYTEPLQKEFGNRARVIVLTSAEFISQQPQKGIVWPYFRSNPDGPEDVLNTATGNLATLNNYSRPGVQMGDKWSDYQRAIAGGIPIPDTQAVASHEDLRNLPFGERFVVKGHPSGQGTDVHLCEGLDAAKRAFDACQAKGLEVVAQHYVQESHGRDLRVLVVGGELVLMLGRQGAPGQFLSNVSGGGHYIPEPQLTEADKRVVQSAVELFPAAEVAGFDFLYGKDGLLFNEINWAPGWREEASPIVGPLARLALKKAALVGE